MTNRICKFGCETLLSGWDDNARKYIEAASGGLHTRERCEELKAQLAQKNDHGNEDYGELKDLKIIKDIDQKRAESKPVSPKEYFENRFSTTTATTGGNTEVVKGPYVDHTQGLKEKLKLKVLTDPTPEGLSLLYNNFGESHNIRFSQYHPVNALYTIAVFFEEVPLKQ